MQEIVHYVYDILSYMSIIIQAYFVKITMNQAIERNVSRV